MEYEIELEFDLIIDNAVNGRSLSLKDYLQDVQDYGEQEFDYGSQAIKLYDRYKFDCEAWVENLEIEKGLKLGELGEIFEKWGNDADDNKRVVVSEMYKEYCYGMLEMISTLEKIKEL